MLAGLCSLGKCDKHRRLPRLHDREPSRGGQGAPARAARLRRTRATSSLVAEFSGLAGYCLVGDVLGTIVFELEERDPVDLYRQFALHLQAAYTNTGGHGRWVATEGEAAAFLAADGIRGFKLSSSIGATGAIWCRGFNKWVEPGGAA